MRCFSGLSRLKIAVLSRFRATGGTRDRQHLLSGHSNAAHALGILPKQKNEYWSIVHTRDLGSKMYGRPRYFPVRTEVSSVMTMNQKCPACRGRKTNGNGRTCEECGGTGEITPRSIEREEQMHVPFRHRNSAQEANSMRKRLITPIRNAVQAAEPRWLELDRAAAVEVTSEDPQHPIEGALVRNDKRGWRALEPGTQTVRLIFDRPRNIERIQLAFDENESVRTQEFVLRWTPNTGQFHEIVRQQWNFTPPATVHEAETFSVQLSGVSTLELIIIPDIGGGPAHASLSQLRLA